MKPSLWVFSISYNEAKMMPWFLRHYSAIADRIIIWDERSTDGTREMVKACPKAELRDWPWEGLDDEKFQGAVNNWWREAMGKADWVCWPDIDELLWHPKLDTFLENRIYSVIAAQGYALMSPAGWPADDGNSQLYELVKTGAPVWNYDKKILWRPTVNMVHTIGRHTYPGQFPKFIGRECPFKIKLFHCHHVGGVEETRQRNQRNYDRALDKKYAWNFAPEANANPKQVGSVAWVEDVMKSGKLEVVA